jgi:hypothetical protein
MASAASTPTAKPGLGRSELVMAWPLREVCTVALSAGAKRSMASAWTGQEIPEVYLPITGRLRDRLHAAVLAPGTLADLR